MNLTSAAIEAAANTVRSAAWGHITPEEAAKEILEAAAPHMCPDLHPQRTEWPDIPRIRS